MSVCHTVYWDIRRQRMAWPWNWGRGRSRSLKLAPFDRLYDFLLVGHCKYSCMLYQFQVIWFWIIMTLKRSLKVIQTGTIRKLGCGFLFAFHSNYGSILHDFRDKAKYWSIFVIFSCPLHSTPPLGGSPSVYFHPVWCVKLEWCGYPMVEKLWGYV